ncbi:MAG TPA: hypothetical protein VJT49_11730 [Amycolatopsis sp.]|uniref:hypothetical protein n=1 Tax=Amycolatopsis sp. TaxID=37632 RepID=UPI002B46C579|nr:hypothetical protein [Amycolatopsis sp.]HKS45757.1 hypothetical protein [Amycolatopsis sp.]
MPVSDAVVECPETSRDVSGLRRETAARHCGWCGRRLEQGTTVGRRRRYCGQSCRQRAYERRSALQRTGLPEDAVVLSDTEIATLLDRLFQLRCAAEDVVTAAEDGVEADELRHMARQLAHTARDLERLR